MKVPYCTCIIGNYSIAGKRGHWPASEDILLSYTNTNSNIRTFKQPFNSQTQIL